MTLQHRSSFHKVFRRQGILGVHSSRGDSQLFPSSPRPTSPPPPDHGNGGNGGGGGNGNGGGGGGNGPVFTAPSSNLSFPPRPTTPPPEQPPTSSKAPPPVTTTTSQTPSSTSTSPTSTTSSSSSSSSTLSTPSSTSTIILTAPGHVAPSSFATLSRDPLTGAGFTTATPSATATPSSSSGVSVGAIVGGIAGALVGIAVLGFLISFILRRVRKRNRRDTITGDEFRRSQFMVDSPNMGNDALEPPIMTQRHHSITPSVNGAGMAGHGAFQGGANMYDNGASGAGAAGYGATGYGATAYGAAGAAAGATMQERPRYTYGQHTEDETDDVAHGVYSSQPQPQVPFNPEAYGSYATYDQPGGAAGAGRYQEATREYQGQGYSQGGYHAQEFGDPSYGVAVADPGPSTSGSAAAAGAHPTASRDPTNLTSNRGQNTRSVVQDDDVYGGI